MLPVFFRMPAVVNFVRREFSFMLGVFFNARESCPHRKTKQGHNGKENPQKGRTTEHCVFCFSRFPAPESRKTTKKEQTITNTPSLFFVVFWFFAAQKTKNQKAIGKTLLGCFSMLGVFRSYKCKASHKPSAMSPP